MVTARAVTRTTIIIEISDCIPISAFARWLSGTVSVGLNDMALTADKYK